MECDQSSKLVSHSDVKLLNKTHIYNKKASDSLGIVYKNNNPKSSPILYNNITISQDNTNQSTITIENKCIEDQKTEHTQTNSCNAVEQMNSDTASVQTSSDRIAIQTNSDRIAIQTNSDRIAIQNIKQNDINLLLNNITHSNTLNNNNKQSIIKKSNEQVNETNDHYAFSSFRDFADYYNLIPQNISETSTCSSWFTSLKSYLNNSNDKNNNINLKYCSEYILSDNLLKTISCINKLVNLILCDIKTLIDNKYVINYINEHLVNFKCNNINLLDPRIDLFSKYQFSKFSKNKLYTDAMTYILYRTFKALQYLLYSLDQPQTNYNSIIQLMPNKEEVNNSKQKLKEILNQSKEIVKQKVNECKIIENKLEEYEKYFNYNKCISDGIIQQINEYENMKNNLTEEKRINKINKEIEKFQNNLIQITNKLSYINSYKNKCKNKLKNIKTEIKAIKNELNKKYKYYINEKNTFNYEYIMNKIRKNLDEYYYNKEQLDSNLFYIYNNNKNLNPIRLNIINNNESQILDNNIKHNDNTKEVLQISNDLQIQKNNIKNYIELLKDIMKQILKNNSKTDNGKVKDINQLV